MLHCLSKNFICYNSKGGGKLVSKKDIEKLRKQNSISILLVEYLYLMNAKKLELFLFRIELLVFKV